MGTRNRRLLYVLGLSAALAACSSGTETDRDTLRVGALVNLNPEGSSDYDANAALGLAAAQIRDYLAKNPGGVDALELVALDTRADPARALKQLAALDAAGIRVVIGPGTSAEAEVLAPYADAHKIILVSPASTASSLAKDDYLLRMVAPDSRQADALVQLLRENGLAAVVPIVRADAFGQSFEADLRAAAALGEGGPAVLPAVALGADRAAVLAKAALAVTEAVAVHGVAKVGVVVLSFEDEGIDLLAKMPPAGTLAGVRWYATMGLINSANLARDEAAAAAAVKTRLAGVTLSSDAGQFYTYAQYVLTETWREVKHPPDDFLLFAWDSLWLVAMTHNLTFAKTGPLDDERAVAGFRDALLKTSNKFFGATGFASLDPATGDRVAGQYALYRFEAGGWRRAGSYVNDPYAGGKVTLKDAAGAVPATTTTVPLGALVPGATGTEALLGPAFDLAVAHIGAYFERTGFPIAIKADRRDTGGDPKTALAQVKELAAEGVQVVAGPGHSAEVAALQSYVAERNLVLVSPSSTALSLALNDRIFRLAPSDEHQARALGDLMAAQGKRAVAVLHVDDPYGSGFYDVFKPYFESASAGTGKVLGRVVYADGTADFTQALAALAALVAKSGAAPDETAVLFVGFDEGVTVLRSLPAALTAVSWYATDSMALDVNLVADARAAANASRVRFTASTFDNRAYGLLLPQQHTLDYLLATVDTPTVAINMYDAAWIAATAYRNHHFAAGTPGEVSLVDEVRRQCNQTVGMGTPTYLNQFGDRGTAGYGFYRVEGRRWAFFATHDNTGFSPGIQFVER
jgi:branched-chain amino acid transport system substrate-binding protein